MWYYFIAKRNIIPNTIDRIKELNISKSNRHLADFSMHNEDQNIRNEVTRYANLLSINLVCTLLFQN